jgi:hypothetical protein
MDKRKRNTIQALREKEHGQKIVDLQIEERAGQTHPGSNVH